VALRFFLVRLAVLRELVETEARRLQVHGALGFVAARLVDGGRERAVRRALLRDAVARRSDERVVRRVRCQRERTDERTARGLLLLGPRRRRDLLLVHLVEPRIVLL